MKKKQQPSQPAKLRFFTRGKIYAAGLILALFFFAQASFVITVKEKNGRFVVTSHLAMEEDFAQPELGLLRKREELDKVTAPAAAQFGKVVLLRKWARSQWEPGSKFYYPPWDALEILDLARKQGNRGFCAQFGVVFLQACLSFGLHARYLDIVGHFITEVWSDEYAKWVVMDPYVDLHYERDGVPLNARELCEAYWKGGAGAIDKVASSGKKTRAVKADIELYRKYALYLRNNQLANPVSISRGGRLESLAHEQDFRRYPKIGSGPSSVTYVHTIVSFRDKFAKENFEAWPILTDLETYDRPVNQTIINIRRSRDQRNFVKVALTADQSPTFGGFLLKFNDGGWQKAPARIMGELKPGFNELSARIATRYGWLGPVSSVTLFYKSPWLGKW